MEKLWRVIAVIGEQNAGKSTLLNLFLLRSCNRPAFDLMMQANSNASKCLGKKFMKAFRREKLVAFNLPNSTGAYQRRVAIATAGDSQTCIKKAFEFAEDTDAHMLVCACRKQKRENLMRYLKLHCDVLGISCEVFEVASGAHSHIGFSTWIIKKVCELDKKVRSSLQDKQMARFDVAKFGICK